MQGWGAIFDLDGTLIDSAQQHRKSWELLAEELGKDLPLNHFEKGFGLPNRKIIAEILSWESESSAIQALSERKEALYRKLLKEEEGISPLSGVLEFLTELQKHKRPCALGTSTSRDNVSMIFAHTDLRHYFPVSVTIDDVEKGKPHPEVFLQGAEKLGMRPSSCVVFEDSPSGIKAGKRAGMFVVGVEYSHPKDMLQEADWIIESFSDLRLVDLLNRICDRK